MPSMRESDKSQDYLTQTLRVDQSQTQRFPTLFSETELHRERYRLCTETLELCRTRKRFDFQSWKEAEARSDKYFGACHAN